MYVPPAVSADSASLMLGLRAPGKKKTRKAFVPGGSVDQRSVGSDSPSVHALQKYESTTFQEPPTVDTTIEHTEEVPEVSEVQEARVEEDVDHAELERCLSNTAQDETFLETVAEPVEDSVPETVTASTDPHTPPLIPLLTEQETLYSSLAAMESERGILELRLTELQDAQNEFCATEQFERADELETEIESIREQIWTVSNKVCHEIPKKIEQLSNEYFDGLSRSVGVVSEELHACKISSATQKDEFSKSISNLESRESKFLAINALFSQREEMIENRRNDLSNDREILNSKINAESDNAVEKKSQAEIEYDRLDTLVADLQAQLAEAMAARSAAAMTISAAQLQLDSVDARFRDELDELENLENELLEEENDLKIEKSNAGGGDLATLEEEMNIIQTEHGSQLEKLESSIANYESDFALLSSFRDSSSRFTAEICSASSDVISLRSQLYSATQLAQLMSTDLHATESNLRSFKSSMTVNKSRLPQLEEEKKIAIAARSFKEAKEISDEIKDVMDQINASNETLGSLRGMVTSARKDLNNALDEELSLRNQMRLVESEFRETEKSILRERIEELEKLLSTISPANSLHELIERERELVTTRLGE
jgi:chromosome segregation ATPase